MANDDPGKFFGKGITAGAGAWLAGLGLSLIARFGVFNRPGQFAHVFIQGFLIEGLRFMGDNAKLPFGGDQVQSLVVADGSLFAIVVGPLALTAALVAGLATSVHCTVMCGPLACAMRVRPRSKTQKRPRRSAWPTRRPACAPRCRA